jgi:hypothetical protein
MKHRVDMIAPPSIDELHKTIQEVWDNLSYNTIDRLLESMNGRCRDVIASNGETIH